MCGIAGLWVSPVSSLEVSAVVMEMRETLARRGPDAAGLWVDAARGIGLGHRRLSVVDLSPEGDQPMHSACGRYVLVFNGEIYNHVQLRHRLEGEGVRFRGHSDTEVLLAACVVWGLDNALRHCNGMFALGLWDRVAGVLALARDRLGKKPLYYGHVGGGLAFASELKALRPAGAWAGGIDEGAALDFRRFGFVPGERAILKGVRKLLPGHLAMFSTPTGAPLQMAYWRLEEAIRRACGAPFAGSRQEAEAQLQDKLRQAVRLRCQADVPVGSFLSGGIDSALVVALMAEVEGVSPHTFTVGFADAAYDESADARQVADALGCAHAEMRLEPGDLAGLAESLPTVYDEPFADVSQIPTLAVARFARRQVTVCLSGDGGDEVFGGYHRHFMVARQWPWLARIPPALRRGIAAVLRSRDPRAGAAWLGRLAGVRTPNEKLEKMLMALEAGDLDTLYLGLLSQAGEGSSPEGTPGGLRLPRDLPDSLGLARRVMAMDTLGYLPDDILVKTDRASMAVGLELRSPLLDVELLEFAWSLPEQWLVRAGKGKRILRRLLSGYLPEALFERPKMGFAVPIGDWLRGSLKPWAGQILLPEMADPWWRSEDIARRWAEHQEGRADHGHWLWRALVWRAWRVHWHV